MLTCTTKPINSKSEIPEDLRRPADDSIESDSEGDKPTGTEENPSGETENDGTRIEEDPATDPTSDVVKADRTVDGEDGDSWDMNESANQQNQPW